jgi:hypothetical protein
MDVSIFLRCGLHQLRSLGPVPGSFLFPGSSRGLSGLAFPEKLVFHSVLFVFPLMNE